MSGYADSSKSTQGMRFGGMKVENPYPLFKKGNCHFIIVGTLQRVNNVRLQLMVQGVTSCSFYFETIYHDFQEEDAVLERQLMEAVNEMLADGETADTAFPLRGNLGAESDYGCTCGYLNGILSSTTWSHLVYLWERQIIRSSQTSHVLEIGPGAGLMSSTLLREFPALKIDWALYGEESSSLDRPEVENIETRSLKKVKDQFAGRVTESWGRIERSSFELPDSKYDMVILTEVFEHFALHPVGTMKKIRNALRDDGYIALSTPN